MTHDFHETIKFQTNERPMKMEKVTENYVDALPPMIRAALDRLQNPQAVWSIFTDENAIIEMERIARTGQPPVIAVEDRLLELGEWVRGHDAKRIFGRLTAFIATNLLHFTQGQSGVRTPQSRLFTKGTLYHPAVNPGDEHLGKKLRAHQEFQKRAKAEGRGTLNMLIEAIRSQDQPKPDTRMHTICFPISASDFATIEALSTYFGIAKNVINESLVSEAIEDMWDRLEEQDPEMGEAVAKIRDELLLKIV